MNTVTLFGITFSVNPVAFSVFGWEIYWYGIIITVGVMLALFYGMKNAEKFGMNPNHIIDSFLVVLPVSILSARAYYIIFEPNTTFADFFNFNGHGFRGLAIYGGVIGAAVSIFIMQRIYKFNLLSALDITSVGFLIGQGIGRWGNFVNQEAYGTLTGSDWFGMTGNRIADEIGSDALVHPCFLYESIWCIIGFFLLNHFSKKRKYKGQIALMYGAWYGFERTFIELLRTDSLMLGNSGIRVSSLLSALLCLACVTVLIVMHKKQSAHKNDAEYVPIFEEGEDMALSEIDLTKDSAKKTDEEPTDSELEEKTEDTSVKDTENTENTEVSKENRGEY